MMKLYILGLILFAQTAYAINLQGFKFSSSENFSYLEDSKINKKKLVTSFAHISEPLFVTDSNSTTYKHAIISSLNDFHVGYYFEYRPEVQLGLNLNLDVESQNNTKVGFSDTTIQAKYRIINIEQIKFSVQGEVTLPTGNKSLYLSSDSLGVTLRSISEKHFQNYHLLFGLGYSYAKNNKFNIIDYRNLVLMEMGLSLDINPEWSSALEINRNFTLRSDSHQDEGDFYITLKNKTAQNFNTYGGFGIAGLNDLDKKNWTVFLGLKYNL